MPALLKCRDSGDLKACQKRAVKAYESIPVGRSAECLCVLLRRFDVASAIRVSRLSTLCFEKAQTTLLSALWWFRHHACS